MPFLRHGMSESQESETDEREEHGVSADWIRNKVASGASKLSGQEGVDRLHKFAKKMNSKNSGAQYGSGKNSAKMADKYLTATFAGHKALGEKIVANGPVKSYRDMGVSHEEAAANRARDEASRAKFNALPSAPAAKASPAPKKSAPAAKASPAPKPAPAPKAAPAPKPAPKKRSSSSSSSSPAPTPTPTYSTYGGGSSAITGGIRLNVRR